MAFIVPPGGLAGFAAMTSASRAALAQGVGRAGRRIGLKAKRKSKKRGKGKRAKSATPRKKGRKLKFGSPAWRKKYSLGKKKRS